MPTATTKLLLSTAISHFRGNTRNSDAFSPTLLLISLSKHTQYFVCPSSAQLENKPYKHENCKQVCQKSSSWKVIQSDSKYLLFKMFKKIRSELSRHSTHDAALPYGKHTSLFSSFSASILQQYNKILYFEDDGKTWSCTRALQSIPPRDLPAWLLHTQRKR